jgi:hypothetical protein
VRALPEGGARPYSAGSDAMQETVNMVPLNGHSPFSALACSSPNMTFVNAYVAQGAIASGRSSAFGNAMRRLGLSLIVASLLLFLAGIALVVLAI